MSSRKVGTVAAVVMFAIASAVTATGAGASSTVAHAQQATSSVLTVAESVAPTTLDPQKSSLGADWYAWQLSYQCLLAQASDGTINPELATSYTVSANKMTYTFALRRGVLFQNGDPFTSADVVYTFRRLKASGLPFTQSLFSTLSTVSRTGTYGVRFTLTQPDPSFLLNMANPSVVGCAIMDHKVTSGLSLKMVGTGPYRMTSYRPNAELDLTPFAKYWGPAPKNGGLKILYVPDALTQEADLLSGKVDLIFPDTSLLKDLITNKSIRLRSVISGLVEELDINSAAKPFDDVRVRRAVALAIDRNAIAKIAFNGAALPSSYLPLSFTWAPKLATMPYQQRNIAKAKQLLAQAGYPNGFNTTLMYIAGYSPQSALVVALLQSQLAEVGIHVTLAPLDQATWGANLNGPKYDLSWNFYGFFNNPYQYLRPRPSRQGPTPASLQTLIDNLANTTPKTLNTALAAIAKQEATLVFPDIPLVNRTIFIAYGRNVRGVKPPTSLARSFLADVSMS